MTSEPRDIEYVGACPAWCVDCEQDSAPDGFVVHQSPAYTTSVYTEDSGPILAAVRATHFDQHPIARQNPPTDLDRPMIDITVHDDAVASLRLTPAQARHLADLLATVANTIDPPNAT